MTTAKLKGSKKPAAPEGLDLSELRAAFDSLKGAAGLRERVERASSYFVGRPYLSNPLCGSRHAREVFTVSLAAFDCVTYVETVLALAFAKSPADFTDTLRRIRYDRGKIDWARRNHYMTRWITSNEDAGFIKDLTTGAGTVSRTRTLAVVEGLAPEKVIFRCIPADSLHVVEDRAETGDIILFVSPRRSLDVFHIGFAVLTGGPICLRHASRSHGRVVDEPLTEFINNHSLSGYILVRPQEI
ncbi:MAG TPA: N-acetylmuramoyl-L-alanine amidase-like domain-containing protein [Blastocatellia bacterium]|nr:N-acetylmuramoyl-L-alanine amidase-like domain-containing protein [Blastocatellia bacterium]